MITHTRGNILMDPSQALVNPVNCVGVMGKGLALQFKQAYPANYRMYAALCRTKALRPGTLYIWHNPDPSATPRFIINFPTKDHWRHPSRLEHIHTGLHALVNEIKRTNIHSIAIPSLGAGLGGLSWDQVMPLIETHLDTIPEISVTIYHPLQSPPTQHPDQHRSHPQSRHRRENK